MRHCQSRYTIFRSGYKALYSTACANLKNGMREAKSDYKRKLEEHLDSNNSRQVVMGVQHIANYRTISKMWEMMYLWQRN